MRFVRTIIAVLLVLAFSVQAHAQYGLYGAPSTLPLQSPHPGAQSEYPQNPPLYVDTQPGPSAASPVAANPAPVYAQQVYANPAYANSGYSAYPMPTQVGATAPGQPPSARHTPYDPAYATPIVPAAAYQAGPKKLPPPPVRAPGQPGAPGPITQMLSEAENPQLPAYNQSATCGTDCGEYCDPCCAPCCPNWFGSVAALYMARNEPNRLWTSYETGNNPNQLPTDAITDWKVGGEVSFGRYFCCGAFAVEATYWGLDTLSGYSSQSIAGGSVSTPLIVSDIEFGGVNGTVYFDSAAEHTVRRENEIQNIEINILGTPGVAYGGCGSGPYGCSPFSLGWNLGVRYFRFEENFLFGSVDTGRTWGEAGGIYEAYLEDNVRNDLVGFQFGCDFSYTMCGNWRLFAAPKLGIYNNHVQHDFGLRRGDGVVANPTAASGMAGTYPVQSSEDVVSFLSEIDLGVDWQVAPHWSVFLGYRVIFATGIALADNQVPTYVVDIPEIADIDTNGDLVLHGAFAGVTVRF
jgi:putative beta barrel porin BBP7